MTKKFNFKVNENALKNVLFFFVNVFFVVSFDRLRCAAR